MTISVATNLAGVRDFARSNTHPCEWQMDIVPPTSTSAPKAKSRQEDRPLLPLVSLRLEPRQRALPARRRDGADRARPRSPNLRAGEELEPRELGRGAWRQSYRRIPLRLSAAGIR